ncbi:MAG: hypothetical protein QXK06_03605 [Candidatus Diapherotrites archaeon]
MPEKHSRELDLARQRQHVLQMMRDHKDSIPPRKMNQLWEYVKWLDQQIEAVRRGQKRIKTQKKPRQQHKRPK